MATNIQQIPGYQLNEYKLILVPHQDLAKHIADTQTEFNQKFKIENPLGIRTQVLLASFKQLQMAEDRITNRLKAVAMASHPFKVEIKNFGSFPTHTIFLNVTSKVPITVLVKKIRHDAQRLMKYDNENKPYFLNDAHIIIAMKLKPWQYEAAWKEYSHKHFTGRFIADHMLLLGRRIGETKYKVVQSFAFENLPVDTIQGELF